MCHYILLIQSSNTSPFFSFYFFYFLWIILVGINLIFLIDDFVYIGSFPGGASGKESACQCRRFKSHGFYSWVRKILWNRKWQPTSVFLPGKFYGQKSLLGYSPWDHKELDMTEHISVLYIFTNLIFHLYYSLILSSRLGLPS